MSGKLPTGTPWSVLDGLEDVYDQAAALWNGVTDHVSGLPPARKVPQPTPVVLRPAQQAEAPKPKRSLTYLADPRNPAIAPFITTRAARNGYAYIDEYPASGLGVRTSVPELRDGMQRLLAGQPLDRGPHVTFRNDNPANPSPNQPLTAQTAAMVSAAILDSGVNSVNINSTTGGHTGAGQAGSRHNQARAVDINQVNGRPVGAGGGANTDPDAIAAVTALQNAYRRQPNIRENFGPAFQEKTRTPGGASAKAPSTRASHQNHVHGAGQR